MGDRQARAEWCSYAATGIDTKASAPPSSRAHRNGAGEQQQGNLPAASLENPRNSILACYSAQMPCEMTYL